MSELADLEVALRRDRAYGRLADTHAHRATREDSLGLVKGRDAILEAWLGSGAQEIEITADLGDMIACAVSQGGESWRGHRWIVREDGRILREILIEDRPRAVTAPSVHPPLGELRSGRGQFAADERALLPPLFPDSLRPAADALHRILNGRAFDRGVEPWAELLIATLPDAVFLFERCLGGGEKGAVLWRVHGHHESGRRIRLIGSTLINGGRPSETVVDFSAMAAQRAAPMIEY